MSIKPLSKELISMYRLSLILLLAVALPGELSQASVPGDALPRGWEGLRLLCIALFTLSAFSRAAGKSDMMLALALLFTCFSDACLLFLDEMAAGVCVFIIAQALHLLRQTRMDGGGLLLALAAGAAVLSLTALGLELLYSAGAVYAVLIVSNLVVALVNAKRSGWRGRQFTLAAGFVLFVFCDAAVALSRLGNAQVAEAAAGAVWPFYLPSQLLIAMSGEAGEAKLRSGMPVPLL